MSDDGPGSAPTMTPFHWVLPCERAEDSDPGPENPCEGPNPSQEGRALKPDRLPKAPLLVLPSGLTFEQERCREPGTRMTR